MKRGKVFVTVVLASFLCVSSGTRYEDKAEYVDSFEDASSVREKEQVSKTEVFFKELFNKPPGAVILELTDPLLETMKRLWRKDTVTDAINQIVLGAFDGNGLQEKIIFNNASKLFQAVENLKAPNLERKAPIPTMQVLTDIIKMNLSEGPILLVTKSKPSDEHLVETLTRSFINKKCQLSVLWGGDKQTDNFLQLEELTKKTGGNFFFLEEIDQEESQEGRYFDESILQLDTAQNFSNQVRFPEDSREVHSRASNQRVFGQVTIPLIVEVASGTSLEVSPGGTTQIPFTVKNNINFPLQVFFNARLNGMNQNAQPPSAVIQPSASIRVIVNVQPFGSAQSSAIGKLTLFATSQNRITARAALIFMSPQGVNDRTEPKIKYKYEGDCSNYKEPHNCENGQWGFEATVYDEESGLLKILSEPYGLYFQSEFIAGTKSPVTVFYNANCCQSKVDIWAEDLKGNYVKRSLDVFNQNLLAGEIAAIVVGVLLLILIIIVIIIAVVLIKRRNRRNIILPRSGSR